LFLLIVFFALGVFTVGVPKGALGVVPELKEEYAYNNSFSTATGLSPFYANYGYHPRTNWPTAETPPHWLHAVHQQAIEQLQKTRERMAKH
jgi:hypothetical protein